MILLELKLICLSDERGKWKNLRQMTPRLEVTTCLSCPYRSLLLFISRFWMSSDVHVRYFCREDQKKTKTRKWHRFFLKKKLNLKENGKSYRKSVFEKFFFFVLALSSYAKIFHVCCEIEKLPRFHPSKPFTNLMVLPIKFPFMYC